MTHPARPKRIEQMIERQHRLWDIRRALAEEGGAAAVRELAHLPEGPWVTFSLQIGTRGLDIARNVATALGWQVFDREILTGIAEHADLRERVVARHDDQPVSRLADYVAHLIVPGHLPHVGYEVELIRTIAAIGRQGHAVLIGRGANWVLDPHYGLRVRLVAPRDARARSLAAAESIDLASAARRVEEYDDAKTAFIRQVYRRDIDDPFGYDLVVNLDKIGAAGAEEIVLAALRGKLTAHAASPSAAPAR